MTSDKGIQYDRSLLGVETYLGTFQVTKEMKLDFARSTGDLNSLYLDEQKANKTEYGGIIAPPTFCNIFVNGMDRPDINLEFGDTGFFAGQAIESVGPIRPGDALDASTKLKEVYSKTGRSGTMVFAVWETTFVNQKKETVALVTESFVRRNSRKS